MASLATPGHGQQEWIETLGAKHFLTTTCINLEEESDFLDWVQDGGALTLPADLLQKQYTSRKEQYSTYTGEDDWSDEGEDDAEPQRHYELGALVRRVEAVLKEYGGGVFATSDARAPTDASWCLANAEHLQCQDATEVLTVVKASTRTTEDWERRRALGLPRHLVLKKWYLLEQGLCFRCFVDAKHRLVGVSQKRLSEFYPFLVDAACTILDACEALHSTVVVPRLAEAEAKPFSYDVYLAKTSAGPGGRKAKLLGFHTLADGTLLFEDECLEELYEAAEEGVTREVVGGVPQLRVIQTRDDIRDCGAATSMRAGIPEDLKDLNTLIEAAKSADNRQTGGEVQGTVDEMIRLMQEEEAAAEAK